MNIFVCSACKLQYKSNCALTTHQYQTPYCYHFITTLEDSSNQQVLGITQSELTHSSDHTNSTNSTNDYINDKILSIDNNNSNEFDENNEDEISIESNTFVNIITFYQSNDNIHKIELLKISNNIGTPLYTYNSLINWTYEASISNYKFDTQGKMYQQ